VDFIESGSAPSDNSESVLIPLTSIHREHGNFCFTIDRALEFELYRPYLHSFSHHVTAVLENKYFLGELNLSHDELEERVEERTAQLHQFEHIVSSTTDMMALLDKNFTYITANAAYLAAFRKTLDELVGHTAYEVFGEVFFNDVIRPNAERCMAGEEVNHQAWMEFPAYKKRYLDVRYYPYINQDNEIVGFVVNARDITNRKIAEMEAAREAEITKNLLKLSEATSNTANLDELMERVVRITRDIVGVDIVLSYIWDSETRTLRPAKESGLAHHMQPLFKLRQLSLNFSLIKGALDSGSVFLESCKTDSEPLKLQQDGLFEWIENVKTISMLPLAGKSVYRGLIVCICLADNVKACGCQSEKKIELMQAIANQTSVVLDAANHYDESLNRAMVLSRKVETIETMSAISKAVLSTLDVSKIIEVTARMVSRLIPCDWVRIIEIDEDKEVFNFIAGFERDRDLKEKIIPFASTSLTEIIATRNSQYISDLRALDSPLEIERELVKEGYKSALRMPITVKGEIIAILGLMSLRAAAFSPDNLSLLYKLSNQVGLALDNARLVTDLEEFSIGTIKALAKTIDAKSAWTRGHSERVTEIALRIGSEMGLSKAEINDLRMCGLLHDIGKIGTSDSILNKPGKLNDEEFCEIKKHPGRSAEILAPIRQLSHLLPVIRAHHECYDGMGYPDGLKGGEIPLLSRILCVADTVDAMGFDRPYRQGLARDKIIAELKRCSGTQFDTEVVTGYLKTINNF